MKNGEIFDCQTSADVLKLLFEAKKEKNPRFSLRAWAQQLELNGHSYFHQVYKGERKLKIDLAKKIIAPLKLDGVDKKYFELMVLEENANTEEERNIYRQLKHAAVPFRGKLDSKLTYLKQEYIKVIADWYHIAILEMANLKQFDSTEKNIFTLLKGRATLLQICDAIDRMIALGLLVKIDGCLKRAPLNTLIAEYGAPVDAIRSHHRQMIELAKDSIEKLPMDKRDIRGATLCIRREDREIIIEKIKAFHQEMAKFAVSEKNGDKLIQFNTQLFELSGD